MYAAFTNQPVPATRPRLAAVDLNQSVGMALQMAAARLEERALLMVNLGEPERALASSARLTQALAKVLLTIADALPPRQPRHHAMVRITTVQDPSGEACVDILVIGRATRQVELPSDLGDHGPRARSIRSSFEAAARSAGAQIHCDSDLGVGAWVRIALPTAR